MGAISITHIVEREPTPTGFPLLGSLTHTYNFVRVHTLKHSQRQTEKNTERLTHREINVKP